MFFKPKPPSKDETKINRVLEIVQEFGPRRGIPVEERVRKRYPGFPEEELQEIINKCVHIEEVAYNIACWVRDGRKSILQFERDLKKQFPDLNQERISVLINQAMYFSMK